MGHMGAHTQGRLWAGLEERVAPGPGAPGLGTCSSSRESKRGDRDKARPGLTSFSGGVTMTPKNEQVASVGWGGRGGTHQVLVALQRRVLVLTPHRACSWPPCLCTCCQSKPVSAQILLLSSATSPSGMISWKLSIKGLGSELRSGPGSQEPHDPRNPTRGRKVGAEPSQTQRACRMGYRLTTLPSLPCTRQMRQRFCCTEINICKVLYNALKNSILQKSGAQGSQRASPCP